jgi:hypothetical protein
MTEDMKLDSSNQIMKANADNFEDKRFEIESCHSFNSQSEATKQNTFANACKQQAKSIWQRFNV